MAPVRTAAAEFSGLVRNPTQEEKRIRFLPATETLAKGQKEEADIALAGNQTLTANKVHSHLRLQRVTHKEKGDHNRSGKIDRLGHHRRNRRLEVAPTRDIWR